MRLGSGMGLVRFLGLRLIIRSQGKRPGGKYPIPSEGAVLPEIAVGWPHFSYTLKAGGRP